MSVHVATRFELNLITQKKMQYILDAALLQASLLNRTLVIPSFVYARACEYHMYVPFSVSPLQLHRNATFEDSEFCADYAIMVNRGDAVGLDTWRELPIEKQMAFRIPISIMIDLPYLRAHYPVITVSEYLRLHGQDPEGESSRGDWQRELYHAHSNVFESNKTKTPSLFVIKNQWYEPSGSIRVDYIPQAMKQRGNWERYPPSQSQESGGYWPPVSTNLSSLANVYSGILDWDAAKRALLSSELGPDIDLDDDKVVENVLNANGWEVLHTFLSLCVSCFFPSYVIFLKLNHPFPLSVAHGDLTSLSSNPSNKLCLARRYEASRTTITTWMPTSS